MYLLGLLIAILSTATWSFTLIHTPVANDDSECPCQCACPSLSRRELLSWAPILGATLSLSSPGLSSAETGIPGIPFSSTRLYRSIRLNNGLRVLLVSDRDAVQAAAALSIAGAGQFSDPPDLPGCAHLMEHLVLSSQKSNFPFPKAPDFEDWLADLDGASNAFTGYQQVCFHFAVPPTVLREALDRFSNLFHEPDVLQVCQNQDILRREIRRVSAELDGTNAALQTFYLVKAATDPGHPFARFARGNLNSLDKLPKEMGINVGEKLFQFYREYYQASSACLVVVAPFDVGSLERWVAPFSGTFSRERKTNRAVPRVFPAPIWRTDKKMRQLLLYRPKGDLAPPKDDTETLSMHWALDLNYIHNDIRKGGGGREAITAPQVGFVLSQILGRRGPGSLYYILFRRGFLPPGPRGLPRITFPVDVSGFQLLKLELGLTLEGFVNRALVVAYVIKAIQSVVSIPTKTPFLVSRQVLSQYAVVAQLHGSILAPRPPDAVELAVDAVETTLQGRNSHNPGEWNRFPPVNDRLQIVALQRAVKKALMIMVDPANAVVVTTATDGALAKGRQSSFIGEAVPFLPPSKWDSETLTGARYHRDDAMSRLPGTVEGLLPPLINNLIPPTIRPPRTHQDAMEDGNQGGNGNWRILRPLPRTRRLRIPRSAPEPSCRCVLVFQLLSPRPARAKTRQAAFAELWKFSFERAVGDLAELGVPAGLAYDMTFNRFGLRLCFLGISQNLPSYSRRFCRRLVRHHKDLLKGPESLDKSIKAAAVDSAKRAQGVSALRKREIERVLEESTAYEAATEAIAFFKSCRGGCVFSQGDLLPSETLALFNDLQSIFSDDLGSYGKSESSTSISFPSIDDLLYQPTWKPRSGSSCNVPGIQLLSDACGRVPR